MKMTELYEKRIEKVDNVVTLNLFAKRIRLCDAMTHHSLVLEGISQTDIKAELESGLIKYEPRLGYGRRESGYSLTKKGIEKIYNTLTED